MMQKFLQSRLLPIIRRRWSYMLFWYLIALWAVVIGITVVFEFAQRQSGWSSPLTLPILASLTAAVSAWLFIRNSQRLPDYRDIANRIEKHDAKLDGLLITAVQQDVPEGKSPTYLQYRVLQEATERSNSSDWRTLVPRWRLIATRCLCGATLALMAYLLTDLRVGWQADALGRAPIFGIVVKPGDVSLEKGEPLVVLAQFGAGSLPVGVDMVVNTSGAPEQRIPLVKTLGDPIFGGSMRDVGADMTYRLVYGGKSTRDFKVSVYEHPRLERADVDLTFPAYTKLEKVHKENTTRISAVEGTKMDLNLQLNKPVASAKLVAHDAAKTEIPLTVEAGKAVVHLDGFGPAASQTYDLQLVDSEKRANKTTQRFVIDVLPNRKPELVVTAPRGDLRPSALEEINFEATVLDDFGAQKYGIGYAVAGGEEKFIELGKDAGPKEKKAFSYTLSLEKFGLKANDLLSFYLWADDIGPDGQTRRSSTDLYFAEVRPFDEIYREDQQAAQQDQAQKDGAPPTPQAQQTRLIELQKQIINATWKLQRDPKAVKYADDAGVVRDSQKDALARAQESAEKSENPEWGTVTESMDKALTKLGDAPKSPAALTPALASEQVAYQALLKLQPANTSVSRQKGQKGGQQSQSQQQRQKQLDQLDLATQKDRYETQSQAAQPPGERREDAQVLSRLEELARRQTEVNNRLRELQTALQEARTPQQREEAQRELKKLEDEQRQVVQDIDELQQRMDRQENQSRLADQRQQLDQTRQNANQAANQVQQQQLGQALASGQRTADQLQDSAQDLRRQTSSQFGEDARNLRTAGRELQQKEQDISEALGALNDKSQRRALSDADPREQLTQQLTEQADRMKEVVEQARQLSTAAENTEQIMSDRLYESIRALATQDAATVKELRSQLAESGALTQSLDRKLNNNNAGEGVRPIQVTEDMTRANNIHQATQSEQRAGNQINQFVQGIERAAESVVGDDAQALAQAMQGLQRAASDLQRDNPGTNGQQGQPGQQGQQGQGQQGQGQQGQDGQQVAQGQGQQGQQGQGQQGQQGQGQQGQQGQGQQGQGQQGQGQQGQGQQGQQGLAQQGQGQQGKQGQGQQGQGQQGQQGQGQQGQGRQGQQGQGQQGLAQQGQGQQGQGQQGQPGQPGRPGQPGQGRPGQPGRPGQQGQVANNNNNNNNGGPGGGGFNNQRVLGPNAGGPRATNDPLDLNNMLGNGAPSSGVDVANAGPITGDNFVNWADNLRDVEQMVDNPELRNAIAAAREQARLMRAAYTKAGEKPDWAKVEVTVLKPLVEVRDRIADELARRGNKDALKPIDRDPTPVRFVDSVKRYYEEVGKDK